MSRNGRAKMRPPAAPIRSSGETFALPPGAVDALLSDSVLIETAPNGTEVRAIRDPDAEVRAAFAAQHSTIEPERCARLLRWDSSGWSCTCGGSGPVGRSPDGIPFANDEILAHAPGEKR